LVHFAFLILLLLATLVSARVAMAAQATAAPTPAALADLLENPDSRKALIDQLRAHEPATGTKQAGTASDAPPAHESPTLRARLADGTQRFLSSLVSDLGQGAADLRAMAEGDGPSMDSSEARALRPLAMSVVTAIVAFVLLRLVALWIYRRIDEWVRAWDGMPRLRHGPKRPLACRSCTGARAPSSARWSSMRWWCCWPPRRRTRQACAAGRTASPSIRWWLCS